MWTYNSDYNKWFANDDSISKDEFDYLKQELKATRYYSRILSGATYLPVNNLMNIYDILGDYQSRDWYISADTTVGSLYSVTAIPPQHATPIDYNSYNDYSKYLTEYGLTLKNLFTPYRLIKDASKNFYYVDVATVGQIDLTTITKNYVIDDVLLVEGHRVLVKDQKVNVVLLSTADPNTYFTGNYTIVSDLGATIEYQYSSEENGIYRYTNGNLVREADLDNYEQCVRYSVSVKRGTTNANKQFHLSRLLNGYYPTTFLSQPIEFIERHNWILRNRVDYNNLFEINYYDVIKHGVQIFNYQGFTYSIPERTIAIGEFGIILNTQEGKSNIIKNKYKVNLRSIAQTSQYYWICGDENTLLRVRKHDFNIDRILLEEIPTTLPQLIITNLKSVSFFNDLVGVVVGELNTILYTENAGETWKRIEIDGFSEYNYNKVIYSTNSSFYVAGNTGVLIEFVNSISGWVAYKRRISQIEDSVDEYLLVENINDIYKTSISTWNISYNYYTQSIPTDKELLFLVTNNNKLIAYDINNSFSQIGTDFIYFDFEQDYKDIRNIKRKQGTNTFYFTGTDPISTHDGIFSFDISNFSTLGTGSSYSNTTVGTSATLEYVGYPNQLYDYNGTELLICGNTSLLGSSTYSTLSFSSLDSTFEDKLKSKMLVVDYDIASKLNFFTDAGDYRLPNSITFSNVTLNNTNSKIGFKPIEHGQTSTNNGTYSETNWLTYWTDTQKTFEYYTNTPLDDSKKVLISTTFSYYVNPSSFTYSSSQVTGSASQISYLAPSILYATHSRYFNQGSTIGTPSVAYDIYLYDYLMVYRVSNFYPVSVGDVLQFESDVVDIELVVNKIVTLGSYKYLYMETNFNQNIINNLQSTISDIKITNLNRYTTVDELKDRFNSHPVSNAYKLDYVDSYGNVTTGTSSVFQLSARFNNLTSYYNLQTSVSVGSITQVNTYTTTYQFSGGVSQSSSIDNYYFAGGINYSNTEVLASDYIYFYEPTTGFVQPAPGDSIIITANGFSDNFIFTMAPPMAPNEVQIGPGPLIPDLLITANNLLTAINSSVTLSPFITALYTTISPSGVSLKISANPGFGAIPNSNPFWKHEAVMPMTSLWNPPGPKFFLGGVNGIITASASAVLVGTMSTLPINNDTALLKINGTSYTYTFKSGTASGLSQVLIAPTITGTLNNLLTNILAGTPGLSLDNFLSSVSGTQISLFADSAFGASPNSVSTWSLKFTLTSALAANAILSGSMSMIPVDGNTAVVTINSNTTTYTFKAAASIINPTEIQIGPSISSTLTNLLKGITSSYPTYISSTSSSVSGSDIINLSVKSGYGSIPNTNSNWQLTYNLTNVSSYVTTDYDMIYTSGFLKFGYSPTYNLMDYLTGLNNPNDINPKFYATKEYLSMPVYKGIPLDSLTFSTAYIDYNGMTYSGGTMSFPGNKILFGTGLKLEYDTILLNTFVDVVIHGSTDYTTEKLLVMNKYYDSLQNAYVLEFHKRLNFALGDALVSNGGALDIISRRTLYQISDDLQELNNIQRAKMKSNSWQDQDLFKYDNYQNELNFKIPTDSYAKVLLSDSDTIQQLSAIIYVDYKNELAMNITKLAKEYNVPISNTINYTNKLYVSCSERHDLVTGEGVVLEFTGGTGSSQQLNPGYFGYHVVTKINDYDFLTDIPYGNIPTVGSDIGYVKYTKQDPFLNYQPVDLIDLGVDGKGKMSLELSIENLKLSNSVYSLINVDFEKYRFRLVDGLNIDTVNLSYAWLLEAELSGAVIGLDTTNNLVWYKGTWLYGRWFGGTWQSGVWMAGDWYGGTWNANTVTDKILTVGVDTKTVDFEQSFWYDGRWFDGTWNAGIWNNGRWYGGSWNNGMWHKGIWNDGTWNNGHFEGGIWVLGTWNAGVFSCTTEPAYWLDGKWYGGDFENGMWYNGAWEQRNGLSRFGTKAYNSRTANWQAGKWVSGSFYSAINTDDNGYLIASDVNKYSIWKTGQWFSGEWYGGIAYNMDFKTGTWYGGILEDIEIIEIDTVNNTITLNGVFYFNTGDNIFIVDNLANNAYSPLGSDSVPGSYLVLYASQDTVNLRTTVYINQNIGTLVSSVTSPMDTGLRVVSKFTNLNWKGGIWTNGIYESGIWEGGIWYNGVFNGIWT